MNEIAVSSRDTLRPWQRHKLMRELATAERTSADLAREYGLSASGIREFKRRHLARIDEIAADLGNEFAGLWIADKRQRVAAYEADYEMSLDGDHASHYEQIRTRTQIKQAVAEELGQLPPRTQVLVAPIVHIVEGIHTEELK